MIKRINLFLLLIAGFVLQINGQLTIADDNYVGIGVTDPVSKLAVGGAGYSTSTLFAENNSTVSGQRAAFFYKSTSGGTWGIGMATSVSLASGNMLVGGNFSVYTSTPLTSRRSYGIRGTVGNATSGYNYGVYGYLNGSNNGAAIFGATPGKTDCNTNGIWAGYFRGDVYVEDVLHCGTLTQDSDITLKKEIRPLTEEGITQMDLLNSINAIKYKMKNPAELNDFDQAVLDTMKVDPRKLAYDEPKYTEDQFGLSAQEVEQVYPELVSRGGDGYLRLNYIGLIPILVDAIKEQDAKIEMMKKEIESLKNPEITN